MELIIFVHSAQGGTRFCRRAPAESPRKITQQQEKTRCLGLLRFRPFLWPEPVARAPYGLDMARRGRVFFDLLAQAVDGNGHRGVIAQGIAAPDALIQGLAAENDVGVGHQKQQQLIRFVFQLDFLPVHKDPTGIFTPFGCSAKAERPPLKGGGRSPAQGQGAVIDAAQWEELAGRTMLDFVYHILYDSNLWLSSVGISAGLFCLADYSDGAVKNILPILGDAGPYLGARALSLLVLALVPQTAVFLFAILCKPLTVFADWGSPAGWAVLYLGGALISWAVALCVQFLALLLWREWSMALAVVLLGSGMVAQLVSFLGVQLGVPSLGHFTLYGLGRQVNPELTLPACAVLAAACLVWGALYSAAAHLVLALRDSV